MGSENHGGFEPSEGPFPTQDQAVIDAGRPAGAGSEQGPPMADLPDMDALVRVSIEQAEALFVQTAADLTRISARLEQGDLEELGEAVKQARQLRAAALNLNEERNRVDKLRKEVGGGCGGAGSLDLDAARAEIGRRLACLRRG